MTATDHTDQDIQLERQILEQLDATSRRIRELQAEEQSLRRLLLKIRNKQIKAQDVTRKNSVTRILIEERILETLRRSQDGVSTAVLGREVAYFFPKLKGVTFRSYLHRLRTRGLIEPSPSRVAAWQLTKSDAKNEEMEMDKSG
jgi:hypothetical protein